jgi:4-amino-4-deoxy-L-arabinose transferase-like glycosyltransferase
VPDSWDRLAVNLVDHGTFGFSGNESTVTRGPIFPLVEVPLYWVFGNRYAGWSISLLLLDTISCVLLVLASRRIWGRRAALLAGLFYAVNLPVVFYTAKIAQLTSMLPLVIAWLCLATLWETCPERKWVPWALGLVSGVAILDKTVFLPVPFACITLHLWTQRRVRPWGPLVRESLIHALVTIAVVAPWTFRNFVVTGGRIVPVQSTFWELFVQDVLYHDLDAARGNNRPDGETLAVFLSKEDAMLAAHGVSSDPPPGTPRPAWEVKREKVFQRICLGWIRNDPVKIMRIKIANLWHFWLRAENWRKTRLMILMQTFYLGGALAGLVLLWRTRQLGRLKYGILLAAILWAEHCPVFAWGRFSLDLVPVLALVFGLGVDAWARQRKPAALTSAGQESGNLSPASP